MATLLRWHDAVTAAGFHVSKLCLAIIVFSFSYEVVGRYFFDAPAWWANEAVSYALCIGVFLAMPEVTRRRGHVAVSLLPELLPPRHARRLQVLLQLTAFFVCAAVAAMSLDQNIRQIVHDVYLIAAVEPIPKVYISVWITYGFLGSALYFLRNLRPGAAASEAAGADLRI